jgi:ribosome recycling factor
MGMGEDVIADLKGRIEKTLEAMRKDLTKIRTGRAHPGMLEGVTVDYYGTKNPLNALATIQIPEARLIVIKPFDRGSIPAIEKGINEAQIGINPQNDGTVIRLPVPALTEERRREIAKQVKKKGEEHKVAIRNERRDANEMIKSLSKDGEITLDDEKRLLEQAQKETDAGIARVDELVAKKEKEVMEI